MMSNYVNEMVIGIVLTYHIPLLPPSLIFIYVLPLHSEVRKVMSQ
jgi:hypothetical protein